MPLPSQVICDNLQKVADLKYIVADFCCQIIIENAIKDVFPNELIIAEEDCEYSETIHNYLHSVDPALATKLRCNFEPSEDIEEVSTKEYYRIPEKLKAESMCIEEVGVKEINIKEGCCAKHETNSRYWVIDPIDGTKGYISNKNYAICSALIVNEMVQASVLVCPRMLAGGESNKERMQVGTAFFAIRGHCAYQMCLQDFSYSKLPLPEFEEKKNRNPKNLVITESAESSHTDYALSSRLLLKLSGFTDAKYYEGSNEIFLKQFKLEREEIDKRKILAHSQCKYGLVARGDADVYVRRARRLGHEECIWVSIFFNFPSEYFDFSKTKFDKLYDRDNFSTTSII